MACIEQAKLVGELKARLVLVGEEENSKLRAELATAKAEIERLRASLHKSVTELNIDQALRDAEDAVIDMHIRKASP